MAHQAGQLSEAEASYRRVLKIKPDHVDAQNNLGVLLMDSKRLLEAEAAYRRALEIKPDHVSAHNNLGNLLKVSKRLAEAEAAYRRALEIKPDYADAHNSLGILLYESKRLPEAEAAYRRALEIKPDYADAHNSLGVLLQDSKRLAEAEAAYRRALGIKPDFAEAHNDLGNLLKDSKRLLEAEAAYRRALEIKPDFADAHYNLGLLLKDRKRLPEAEAAYRRALEIKPDHAEARLNLSLLLLTLLRYDEAWPIYESRYAPEHKEVAVKAPDLSYPRWQGESLVGKSLVIWPEQGFGDYIQFVRYVPLLKARGVAHLTLVCSPPLSVLLATVEGVDAAVTDLAQLPAHDYWSFVMSLPLHCATTADTIPVEPMPYVQALPSRAAQWRESLPAAGLKVGVAWKGNAKHKNDSNRSLPGLASLLPLWSVPGLTFISLQKGQGEEEALQAPEGQPIVALGAQMQDFADSAAIVSQLDLVICVDTAIAHVAGALGKPCWVLLPSMGTDWRWLLDRTDSPWYPSVRLFRQTDLEDWSETIDDVATALRLWVDAQPQGLTLSSQTGDGSPKVLFQAALAAHESGRLIEAEAAYRRTLELKPDHVDAQNNLGVLLQNSKRLAEAEVAYRRALAIKPDYADVHCNLGVLLKNSKRLPEAEAAYRRALAIKPDYAEAHYNLGVLLRENKRLPEAEAVYRRALEIKPDHPEARWNLSLLLLSLQSYNEAWQLHESRYAPERKAVIVKMPDLPYHQWQGESLAGKSLVIWPEQGFGDYIQFVRYVPLLKARGVTRLTLVCSPALSVLLSTVVGVDAVVTDQAQLPVHDYWSFVMSLPLHCATTAETIPVEPMPYVHAPPSRVAQWCERLPAAGLKVGLVWKGSSVHKNDSNRSLPGLASLLPLWSVPGVSFISLQKGQGEEEAFQPPAEQPIVALGAQMQDFADSAAIVSQLDLVICVDTAIAHVAGALGKPCWVLLPAMGTDWRWLLDRTDSPWYPSARLFRQTDLEDWSEMVREVANALKTWAMMQRG